MMLAEYGEKQGPLCAAASLGRFEGRRSSSFVVIDMIGDSGRIDIISFYALLPSSFATTVLESSARMDWKSENVVSSCRPKHRIDW